MATNNENKIRELSKKINEVSFTFDHDFEELLESGMDYSLIADTMEDELTYQIENIITRFELSNPDLFIVGITRQHDEELDAPEVILDWIDLTDEED